ncbi:MAG: hypothetical protein IKJ39_11650 [Lachnospiraceae bacterium]|nr:hypothetical protein [Lachnospiraceae bacterium]
MLLQTESKKKYISYLQYLYPLILFLYPLRHIRVGMEWNDTGYNYANFMYMDRMDEMWLFSTYLGNALGNVLTRLPFGNTMIGMNIYTGLLVSIMAVGGYCFFTRLINVPKLLVFLGEFLAINLCWCPTALLYNYLTYFLLGIGYVFLYHALMAEGTKRNISFVLSGAMLGINVFTRFSNLSHMALIVAVWAMGIIQKQKVIKVIQDTLWCVLGYIAGVGMVFGWISLRYGARNYVNAIVRLLRMPAEASSYTITSMVTSQLQNYLQNLFWLAYLAVFVLISVMVYKCFPKKLQWIAKVGYVGGVVLFFYYLRNQNMYNFKYSTTPSMFQWAVILLTLTMLVGIIVIFDKTFTLQEKLLCGMNMILIVITPLGSNNHLYGSINNLFLVAPFTLWMCFRFIKWLPKQFSVGKKRYLIYTYPVKAMCWCVFAMILVQITLFGWVFVFQEGNGGENLHTKIEKNEVLKGIFTTAERAEVLESISSYVEENGLSGKEVILYGNLPSMSYYLEMPFAITAWPDLSSYNFGIMVQDLMELESQIAKKERDLPIVLLEAMQGSYLLDGEIALDQADMSEEQKNKIVEDPKLKLIQSWLYNYGYTDVFRNEKFVLFRAEAMK